MSKSEIPVESVFAAPWLLGSLLASSRVQRSPVQVNAWYLKGGSLDRNLHDVEIVSPSMLQIVQDAYIPYPAEFIPIEGVKFPFTPDGIRSITRYDVNVDGTRGIQQITMQRTIEAFWKEEPRASYWLQALVRPWRAEFVMPAEKVFSDEHIDAIRVFLGGYKPETIQLAKCITLDPLNIKPLTEEQPWSWLSQDSRSSYLTTMMNMFSYEGPHFPAYAGARAFGRGIFTFALRALEMDEQQIDEIISRH